MTKTLIKNGTVVNATGAAAADVLIDGGTIAAVLAPGSTLLGFDVESHVDTVLDASGRYVIPGGVDAHTHMEMPFGGTFASDTFETGTRAALYVINVPAKQAVEQIAAARGRGQNVYGETCPQYLYLSLEEQLGAPGFEGAKWVCSTPLRSRAEGHQDHMWRALRTNDLQMVSTDHCPFCMKGQKDLGLGDFSKIPNGIGSVEHRMDLLYQGVVEGRISLDRW